VALRTAVILRILSISENIGPPCKNVEVMTELSPCAHEIKPDDLSDKLYLFVVDQLVLFDIGFVTFLYECEISEVDAYTTDIGE